VFFWDTGSVKFYAYKRGRNISFQPIQLVSTDEEVILSELTTISSVPECVEEMQFSVVVEESLGAVYLEMYSYHNSTTADYIRRGVLVPDAVQDFPMYITIQASDTMAYTVTNPEGSTCVVRLVGCTWNDYNISDRLSWR
jgi:hypothetical protein